MSKLSDLWFQQTGAVSLSDWVVKFRIIYTVDIVTNYRWLVRVTVYIQLIADRLIGATVYRISMEKENVKNEYLTWLWNSFHFKLAFGAITVFIIQSMTSIVSRIIFKCLKPNLLLHYFQHEQEFILHIKECYRRLIASFCRLLLSVTDERFWQHTSHMWRSIQFVTRPQPKYFWFSSNLNIFWWYQRIGSISKTRCKWSRRIRPALWRFSEKVSQKPDNFETDFPGHLWTNFDKEAHAFFTHFFLTSCQNWLAFWRISTVFT